MAALDTAFASVRQGGPSAVLLGGEAGVGKSRLVGEFGRTAAAGGARVLTGGCLELGTDGLPFAPFTAVLRDLVHEMGADGVASMLPGRTTRGWPGCCLSWGGPDTPAIPPRPRRGCSRCSRRFGPGLGFAYRPRSRGALGRPSPAGFC